MSKTTERLEELLADNTEMAQQIKQIADLAPADPEVICQDCAFKFCILFFCSPQPQTI